jgi:hypothetical protein
MGANALKLARRYGPSEIAKELEEVYTTILRNAVHELAI